MVTQIGVGDTKLGSNLIGEELVITLLVILKRVGKFKELVKKTYKNTKLYIEKLVNLRKTNKCY